MTIAERVEKIHELEKIETPWNVNCAFGKGSLTLFGSQICFSNDGDYLDLNQAREVIQWYVLQLGGKVKWNKNEKA